jgi:hypothetical protein
MQKTSVFCAAQVRTHQLQVPKTNPLVLIASLENVELKKDNHRQRLPVLIVVWVSIDLVMTKI